MNSKLIVSTVRLAFQYSDCISSGRDISEMPFGIVANVCDGIEQEFRFKSCRRTKNTLQTYLSENRRARPRHPIWKFCSKTKINFPRFATDDFIWCWCDAGKWKPVFILASAKRQCRWRNRHTGGMKRKRSSGKKIRMKERRVSWQLPGMTVLHNACATLCLPRDCHSGCRTLESRCTLTRKPNSMSNGRRPCKIRFQLIFIVLVVRRWLSAYLFCSRANQPQHQHRIRSSEKCYF